MSKAYGDSADDTMYMFYILQGKHRYIRRRSKRRPFLFISIQQPTLNGKFKTLYLTSNIYSDIR